MFTGIIRHVGAVESIRPGAGGKRLAVDLGPLAEGLGLGDSVAVSGVCLTVAAIQGSCAEFDVISETLQRTRLGELRAGSRANLERSLRVGDSLDGHIVQGHVDGLGEVVAVFGDGGRHVIEIAADRAVTDQLVTKGSVAIDGVSLTLVDVSDGRFSVALIPTTLDETTLGELKAGRKVNIEADVLGKYVRRMLARMAPAAPGGLTMEKLKDAGFL